MSKKTYELKDLIIDACDSFDNDYDWGENGDNYDADEVMHEIADSGVPIYYWDIAQYAAHNSWLMTEKPDINTDGNAHDQIQANIYCAIYDGLLEHIAEKESKDE
tara:strand:+ start:459 stop:773 length:315 start_codon:yes stop_codon:yes gene_type:complete